MTAHKERLQQIFEQVLKLEASFDNLSTLSIANCEQWDSFAHMELMMAVDQEFGLAAIGSSKFAELTSFSRILESIEGQLGE